MPGPNDPRPDHRSLMTVIFACVAAVTGVLLVLGLFWLLVNIVP